MDGSEINAARIRGIGGERGVPRRNRRGCDNDSLTVQKGVGSRCRNGPQGASHNDSRPLFEPPLDGGRGRDLIDPGADVNDVTADPDRDTRLNLKRSYSSAFRPCLRSLL